MAQRHVNCHLMPSKTLYYNTLLNYITIITGGSGNNEVLIYANGQRYAHG